MGLGSVGKKFLDLLDIGDRTLRYNLSVDYQRRSGTKTILGHFFYVCNMFRGSRLAASLMERAEKNIEERIEDLNLKYHQSRQLSVTEELLDIVAGFEAITSKPRKHNENSTKPPYL